MRRLLTNVILIFLTVTSLRAQTAEETAGIETTITSQLEAFTSRDVSEAFTFASPMIQGMFGTPQNFGIMVERGYPMVWNNEEVRFGDQQDLGDIILQRVYIRDTSGTLHALEYAMVELPGGWRINGVQLLPSPDLGV